MSRTVTVERFWLGSLVVMAALLCAARVVATGRVQATPAGTPAPIGDPWPAAATLEPADLAKMITGADPKPTIVYVGFTALFRPGHIPGATLHGPASQPAGLADLRQWAEPLPRTTAIVIYCGCCPFKQCPNVRPAFKALAEMGFTSVRVMVVPANFATDWVDKGYPVETR